MKSLIAVLCVFGVVALMTGISVLAAETTSVTATVTVQNISVSVSDGTVAYGTLAVGTSKSTCDLSDTQTLTNDGNVTEDFNIKGQNSASWTLAETAGSEEYVHEFSTDTCPVSTWTPLTTDYQTAATGITAGGTSPLNLQITTPTATNDYTEQSVDVTILAVAG